MVTTFKLMFEGNALCSRMTQQSVAANELCDLGHQMGEAERSHDEAFFNTVLAEKLTFQRANGATVDKDIFLNDLIDPANTFDTLTSDDIPASS